MVSSFFLFNEKFELASVVQAFRALSFSSFVSHFEKGGRWDCFLCDSFVMDVDGERFLLVSPPDYKTKTNFSLN